MQSTILDGHYSWQRVSYTWQAALMIYIFKHAEGHDSFELVRAELILGHTMMTSSNGNIFNVTGPFVMGIHGSPVDSPHKGQWRGALMFSLICAWTNGRANTRDAGDLRRHHAHYDAIVMHKNVFVFSNTSRPLDGTCDGISFRGQELPTCSPFLLVAYWTADRHVVRSCPASLYRKQMSSCSFIVPGVFGAKTLSGPMLSYCQLDPQEHIAVKFKLECNNFHSRKYVWIYLQDVSHFVSASMRKARWLRICRN